MTTRRERIREATKEEIKAIARQQMAEQGTAAINWREIARQMEVTPTALYRYYASRDDLITDLILDAYNAHADALEAADATQKPDDYAGRLLTALMTFRQWALEHPTDFALIYGNPIPGYHAPDESTLRAARRNMAVFVRILHEANQAGVFQPRDVHIPETVMPQLTAMSDDGTDPILLYIGTVGWARVHGIIMLELFNHIQPIVDDTGAFYRAEILKLMRHMGMPVES